MSDPVTDWLDAAKARADAAECGPWEAGDRQLVAGVVPEKFGEGRCAYCEGRGEPTHVGPMEINGQHRVGHVHTTDEPWWDHGIFAIRESGSVSVVNDTDEYGYMEPADAAFIAAARTDLPAAITALRAVLAEAEVADSDATLGAGEPQIGYVPSNHLRRAIAAALGVTAPRCPSCGHELQAAVHSAPGYEGVEYTLCPSCGWQAEP